PPTSHDGRQFSCSVAQICRTNRPRKPGCSMFSNGELSMRKLGLFIALVLVGCGDDGPIKASIDAAPLPPGVKVSGQIVRAPGQPVPIADVTVSVIDPVEDPENLISAKTDDHGVFVLPDVHPTSGGRVRLFIDGTTGGGGPFVVMNSEFPVSPM